MTLHRVTLFALAALLLPLGGAGAAPQMLGLVATNQPIPLRCDDDTCYGS